jgi:hypothetical protein
MGTISRFDLKDIRESYNLNTFIETGTLYGEGVDYALQQGFSNIITIDIDPELVLLAKQKYKYNSNVTVLEGNSFDVLNDIIPTINHNCLFWLDAHFPGADLHKQAYNSVENLDIRMPLEKELEIIKKYRYSYDDVIISDDLWLYEDEDLIECGTLENHMKKCGINLTKEQIVCGKNLDFIRENMLDKFELRKYHMDQGYMVLFPKQ